MRNKAYSPKCLLGVFYEPRPAANGLAIAANSFDSDLESDWDPPYDRAYNLVWALHVDGTRLHTGGEFTTVSGIKETNYACLSSELDIMPPTIASMTPANGQTDRCHRALYPELRALEV